MSVVVQAEFLPPSLVSGFDLEGLTGSSEGASKHKIWFGDGKTNSVCYWGYFMLYKRSLWAAKVL